MKFIRAIMYMCIAFSCKCGGYTFRYSLKDILNEYSIGLMNMLIKRHVAWWNVIWYRVPFTVNHSHQYILLELFPIIDFCAIGLMHSQPLFMNVPARQQIHHIQVQPNTSPSKLDPRARPDTRIITKIIISQLWKRKLYRRLFENT